MVRRVLYDLFGKGLITGVRVKDERKGWFVIDAFKEMRLKFHRKSKNKILNRLQQRLDYENSSDFYHCVMVIVQDNFENALDLVFKCPSCNQVLNVMIPI